jgi:hypothetical protein
MLRSILSVLFPFMPFIALTQGIMQINSNIHFISVNGAAIVLNNIGITNNGNIDHNNGNNAFFLYGNLDVQLSGNGNTNMERMVLNKNGRKVILQQPLTISSELVFTSGLLDLDNYSVDLLSTGVLTGESETSRAYTIGAGYIQSTATLAAPYNSNPGNLGAIITSGKDLGTVIIRRGHQAQPGLSAGSLLRYYDITPSNNSALNASLQFSYFDAELNGLAEGSVNIWTSQDHMNWINLGWDARDLNSNKILKNGINSFSRTSLSGSTTPLPVHFISFDITCYVNQPHLSWTTTEELNVDHFEIQSSEEGRSWVIKGKLLPGKTGSGEKSYSFTDSNNSVKNFYRIAAIDLDGKRTFSSVIQMDCFGYKKEIEAWPNPVKNDVTVSYWSEKPIMSNVTLYDSKGAIVRKEQRALFTGKNNFTFNMGNLPRGTYHLVLISDIRHYYLKLIKN